MLARGVAIERKHLAQSGVEHERLVAEDEELVEGEAGRRGDVGDKSGQTENAGGDFIDLGLHGGVSGLRGPVSPTRLLPKLWVCQIWMHTLVY